MILNSKQEIHQWAKSFFALPTRPISGDIARIFLRASTIPESYTIDDLFEGKEELREEAGAVTMMAEVEKFQLSINGAAFAAIISACRTIEDMTVFVCALRAWQLSNGGQIIRMKELVELFALRFPTKNSMKKAWSGLSDGEAWAALLPRKYKECKAS